VMGLLFQFFCRFCLSDTNFDWILLQFVKFQFFCRFYLYRFTSRGKLTRDLFQFFCRFYGEDEECEASPLAWFQFFCRFYRQIDYRLVNPVIVSILL